MAVLDPAVPTAVKEGFENLIWEGFHGVSPRQKPSPEIVSRLANASRAVTAEKGFKHSFLESGLEPQGIAPVSLYQLKQNTLGIHLHDFFLLLPKTSRPKKLSISRWKRARRRHLLASVRVA